ncbi:MAG: S41 family peptidase [bacterium]|nr:S41 family peptidase [bacterium]
MSIKQIRSVILIIALILIAGFTGYRLGQKNLQISTKNGQPEVTIDQKVPIGKENVDFSLFWNAWDRIESSYLDKSKIDKKKMVYGAIEGMVASLGDPYTVFLPPDEQKQSQEDLSGSFDGVGLQLGYKQSLITGGNKDSKLAVISPLSGTPAQKAGIKAGDLIVKIKDEKKKIDRDTVGITLPEAVNIIRGPKGTSVTLTLVREGKTDPFDVKLTRGTILVKSVELDIKDNIANLKLLRFGEKTDQEWDDAVKKIADGRKKGEIRGMVLDLRNNPGGFLQGAIYVAGEFLASGVVVKQENAEGRGSQTFSVDRKGTLLDIPMVVLINEGSASASEIVAGALQDNKRARLVGVKTFGKGTIQEAQDLPGGSGLHITIARWLIPSGKWIDKEGIKPDIEVIIQLAEDEKDSPRGEAGSTKDPQLDKALELLKK